MVSDTYSFRHTSGNHDAMADHELGVRAFCAHRPFLPHLTSALAKDKALVAPQALAGIAHAMMGRDIGMTMSRQLVQGTRARLRAARGGTEHEAALAAAHEHAAFGRLGQAAGVLEQHLAAYPRDLLALKLCHALRFMSGEAGRMLSTCNSTVSHWSDEMPGFGFVLGCRAFALEECGARAEAEATGRRAVMHEPDDVWALHAVAHVLEMDNRTREGRILLEPGRQSWSGCGGFGQHLQWHLALFHLAEGDHARALSLYDDGITPSREGCFRDMANAVSLLWRLEQEGVDVGSRWAPVREIARERRRDATYAFGSLHYLLAMIANGDHAGAQDLLTALRHKANLNSDDQSAVISDVALPLAELLADEVRQMFAGSAALLVARLPLLGGSHAQRDVFLRTLLLIAAETSDLSALATVGEIRRKQRRHDRFVDLVRQRVTSSQLPTRSMKEAV